MGMWWYKNKARHTTMYNNVKLFVIAMKVSMIGEKCDIMYGNALWKL